MSWSRSYPFAFGLALCLLVAAATRGGHLRLFWFPVAMLIGLLGAVHLLSLALSSRRPRLNPWADLTLLCFLGWAFVSIPTSIYPEQSIYEALRLAALVMVYFLAAQAVWGEGPRKALLLLIFLVATAEAGYSLLELYAGQPPLAPWWLTEPLWPGRAHGTYLNYNHFANLMVMGAFVGLGLIVSARKHPDQPRSEVLSQQAILAMLLAVVLAALAMSLSRGAWASFLAGGFLFVFLLFQRLRRVWAVAAAALVALVVGGMLLVNLERGPLVQRLESIAAIYEDPEVGMNDRISAWKSAVAIVGDHPVVGTGWGSFHSAYPSYRRDGLIAGFVFAHNDYLQIAAELGVPGLVLFLLFLGMTVNGGFKVIAAGADDALARAMPGLLAALFATAVHELVDFSLMIPANAIAFFILAGLVNSRGEGR